MHKTIRIMTEKDARTHRYLHAYVHPQISSVRHCIYSTHMILLFLGGVLHIMIYFRELHMFLWKMYVVFKVNLFTSHVDLQHF